MGEMLIYYIIKFSWGILGLNSFSKFWLKKAAAEKISHATRLEKWVKKKIKHMLQYQSE